MSALGAIAEQSQYWGGRYWNVVLRGACLGAVWKERSWQMSTVAQSYNCSKRAPALSKGKMLYAIVE